MPRTTAVALVGVASSAAVETCAGVSSGAGQLAVAGGDSQREASVGPRLPPATIVHVSACFHLLSREAGARLGGGAGTGDRFPVV